MQQVVQAYPRQSSPKTSACDCLHIAGAQLQLARFRCNILVVVVVGGGERLTQINTSQILFFHQWSNLCTCGFVQGWC